MDLKKEFSRCITIILLFSFFSNCTAYKRATLEPDDPIPVEKEIILLRWENRFRVISNVKIENGILTGTVVPNKRRHTSRKKQAIIYIAKPIEDVPQVNHKYSFPVSEIDHVEIFEKDPATGALLTLLVGVPLVAFALLLIWAMMKGESCPFVYAYNGTDYKLEGEIYSGAIYPSLERHDYLPLYNLQPFKNQYNLKLSNEVKEIQYTNLAELYVVDHHRKSEVLFDKYGQLQTFSRVQEPQSAQSLPGDDITELIARKDESLYTGNLKKQDAALMDGMILTFKKPAHADTAKLVIRSKNSIWFDYVFGQFTKKFGTFYETWREMQKQAPPEKLRKWMEDQGLPLSVYIEKDGDWQLADRFNLPGPIALRDDVLALDVSDVTSPELRIKLQYGFSFWEVDYVAMDFSQTQPCFTESVPLHSAIDQDGQDVAELLLHDDENYQVLADIGEQVTIKYSVPETRKGMKRSVFLHSKGHYEAIRTIQGEPDFVSLKAFQQPGRFIEFSKEKLWEITKMREN